MVGKKNLAKKRAIVVVFRETSLISENMSCRGSFTNSPQKRIHYLRKNRVAFVAAEIDAMP